MELRSKEKDDGSSTPPKKKATSEILKKKNSSPAPKETPPKKSATAPKETTPKNSPTPPPKLTAISPKDVVSFPKWRKEHEGQYFKLEPTETGKLPTYTEIMDSWTDTTKKTVKFSQIALVGKKY
jgi:hypothetical protein